MNGCQVRYGRNTEFSGSADFAGQSDLVNWPYMATRWHLLIQFMAGLRAKMIFSKIHYKLCSYVPPCHKGQFTKSLFVRKSCAPEFSITKKFR